MKKILLLSTLFLSVVPLCAQLPINNGWKDYSLNGQVKSIVQTVNDVKESNMQVVPGKSRKFFDNKLVITFRPQGSINSEYDLNTAISNSQRTIYEYRANGCSRSSHTFLVNMQDEPLETIITNYNEKGYATEVIREMQMSPIFRSRYVYDDQNRICRIDRRNELGIGKNYYTLSYNANNCIEQITHHSTNGNIIATYQYAYDDNANLTLAKALLKSGKVKSAISLTYDGANRVVSAQSDSATQEALQLLTEIDSRYKELTTLKINNGSHRFDYRLDDMGNWVQCITYHNDKPIHVLVREIEYWM